MKVLKLSKDNLKVIDIELKLKDYYKNLENRKIKIKLNISEPRSCGFGRLLVGTQCLADT